MFQNVNATLSLIDTVVEDTPVAGTNDAAANACPADCLENTWSELESSDSETSLFRSVNSTLQLIDCIVSGADERDTATIADELHQLSDGRFQAVSSRVKSEAPAVSV